MRRETLVSVVVPVFNSTVTRELAERIDATFAKLPDYDYELILVDDDSTDPEVWPMLEELAANGAHIRSIQLTRNFGQQAATLCGLAEATGELVITMDDDLQHRPEDIPILLEARHHDVVIGQFAVKHHDWGQRLTSRIKGVFDRIIIGKPGNIQLSSFRMLSRSVVNGVLSCRTAQPFLPGLIFHVSRNVVGVALSHEPRRTGSSGYTWGKRLVVFSHLLINNSSLILRLVGQVGIGLALIGFALAATAAYRKVFYGIGLQGWTSLFAAQLLIGGLLLFCSGVTGEYLLRILATSERRPTFFVRVRRSGGGKALSVQPAGPKEGAPGDKKRFNVPFNRPFVTGREGAYIHQAISSYHLSADGDFTRHCQEWLEARLGCSKALLTHSGTGALEMAAILAGIGPGDEVILPSYTFPSTANAFVLRGAVPVFVDIRPDTLNLDETKIGDAISPRTRAIVVVHYAGVCCEMDSINSTAREHGLFVIEDAAHATLASYHGRPAGSLGDFGALSFHETKNLSCGEGGALLVNDRRFVERAEVVRQKGTDRSRFLRREIDKYSWVDVGSSFVPSEINAAFLWAQMESADAITRERIRIWDRYHAAFAPLEVTGLVRRPIVPAHCTHTAHLFYLLLADPAARSRALLELTAAGIQALFHYVPLHDSVAGRVHGRCAGELNVTTSVSERLLRLPLWCGLGEEEIGSVVNAVAGVLAHAS